MQTWFIFMGKNTHFRNLVAHSEGLALLFPNMTYAEIEFSRDAIQQVFPQNSAAVLRALRRQGFV